MVNWSKIRCKQGKATRRKRLKFVTLNIYCFYTFKNIRECQRRNASKTIDHCNITIVSRDLSRLRTSRAIMLCGRSLSLLEIIHCHQCRARHADIYRPIWRCCRCIISLVNAATLLFYSECSET